MIAKLFLLAVVASQALSSTGDQKSLMSLVRHEASLQAMEYMRQDTSDRLERAISEYNHQIALSHKKEFAKQHDFFWGSDYKCTGGKNPAKLTK